MARSHLPRMCVTGFLTRIGKASRRELEMYRALALGLSTQKIGLSSIFVVPDSLRHARWLGKFPTTVLTPELKPHVGGHVPLTLRGTHGLNLGNKHSSSLWPHSLGKHHGHNQLGSRPPSRLIAPSHSPETPTFPNEPGSCFSFCTGSPGPRNLARFC